MVVARAILDITGKSLAVKRQEMAVDAKSAMSQINSAATRRLTRNRASMR